MPPPLQLEELLRRLGGANVRYVLVGGLAVNAWGYLRATRDVDLVPDPSAENLKRLDALLRELGGKVEVGGQLLDGGAISTFLRTGDRTLVLTDLGQVDVLQGLPQVPPFSALDRAATDVDLGRPRRRRLAERNLVVVSASRKGAEPLSRAAPIAPAPSNLIGWTATFSPADSPLPASPPTALPRSGSGWRAAPAPMRR